MRLTPHSVRSKLRGIKPEDTKSPEIVAMESLSEMLIRILV